MSTIEDTVILYNKTAWEIIENIFEPIHLSRYPFFKPNELQDILAFINACNHRVDHNSGDHLIYYVDCPTSNSGRNLLFGRVLAFMSPDDFCIFTIDDNAFDNIIGHYESIAFGVSIEKNIDWKSAGMTIGTSGLTVKQSNTPTNIIQPTVSAPVDNYTCACGNKKLNSTTDKSCWKCGAKVI